MGLFNRWYSKGKSEEDYAKMLEDKERARKGRLEQRSGEFIEEVFPEGIPDFGVYGVAKREGIGHRITRVLRVVATEVSNIELAESAGFNVRGYKNGPYRMASKGNYFLDVDGEDGLYRIWKNEEYDAGPISVQRNLDDAISWVDRMVMGSEE